MACCCICFFIEPATLCNSCSFFDTSDSRGVPSSRRHRSGRKAGRQTGIYSVPASGKEGRKRSPLPMKTVCPAFTSSVPPECSSSSLPLMTAIHSSYWSVSHGSAVGAEIWTWAIEIRSSLEATFPAYSSIVNESPSTTRSAPPTMLGMCANLRTH
eukprot:scaffold76030_cov31-Tisochrysis_lutea.AAC.1